MLGFKHGACYSTLGKSGHLDYIGSMLWRNSRGRVKNAPAAFIVPCRPIIAERPPTESGWAHELKHRAMVGCGSITVDNDIEAPGVPFLFVMLAQMSASTGERSGFSNDGTGSQKDWQALRRRTVARKRR